MSVRLGVQGSGSRFKARLQIQHGGVRGPRFERCNQVECRIWNLGLSSAVKE